MNAQTFIDALRAIEERRDFAAMLALYDDDSECRNANDPRRYRGRDGAERFWRSYRAAFERVRSSFRAVVEDETHAVLEWTSRGQSVHGAPCEYEGVSVIDFRDDGRVHRFRAYFDSAALVDALNGNLTPAILESDETSPTGIASAPSGA